MSTSTTEATGSLQVKVQHGCLDSKKVTKNLLLAYNRSALGNYQVGARGEGLERLFQPYWVCLPRKVFQAKNLPGGFIQKSANV